MGRWQNQKRSACPKPIGQKTASFECITRDLSFRAKRILKELGIEDIEDKDALLTLTREDLLQIRSCGKKTIAEIEVLQSKLQPQDKQEAILESGDTLSFDDIPVDVFHAVQSKLSVRGMHVLETLSASERGDAAQLEKHRQQIERKTIKLKEEQTRAQEELVVINEELDRLKQERKEIEKGQGIRDEISKRAALAAATGDALKSIHKEFTGETRDMIGASATKYFRELLDHEGKKTLRHVVVDSDYSIQVYDRWQKPFLANISAGQRQVMSIAFIAALAGAAAGSDVLEMPLFMDTPFGRLSYEHRRNLLEHVPKWCTQWVLLATDTEFGHFEAQILRSTNRWAKFYILKGVGAGSTKIEAMDPKQANGLLRDEAEVK